MIYYFDRHFNDTDTELSRPEYRLKVEREPVNLATRENLFYRRSLPVLTKIRNSAPTRYAPGCLVKNSLVADGCVIEGEVEDSILFRGVHIGKGTKISRSILMQDTQVGEKVHLGCVITDKNVTIRNGHELCGHEAMPFYIDKGSMI